MSLKPRILRSLTRLFIILVRLTRSLFSEKMLISNRSISGLMSNLIKKSWTVSNVDDPIVHCFWKFRKIFSKVSLPCAYKVQDCRSRLVEVDYFKNFFPAFVFFSICFRDLSLKKSWYKYISTFVAHFFIISASRQSWLSFKEFNYR